MTLNNLMSAVAAKLEELWPGRKITPNKLPQNADGQFFFRLIDSEQNKHLDRRRHRVLQFEILYFLQSDNILDFHDWAETMYDHFELLEVGDRVVHLSEQKARRNGEARVYQFTFTADFYVVYETPPGDDMESVQLKEALKE